jgi:hypothetical protein
LYRYRCNPRSRSAGVGALPLERPDAAVRARWKGVAVMGFDELAREYEARRFPPRRRLDLQAEGPQTARDRALRWIQSFAHEEPGEELLLIVERGGRPGRPAGPIRRAVEQLLGELQGRLIEWWQPFGDGSLALRLSAEPRLTPFGGELADGPEGEGRTAETAGTALLAVHHDIPPELADLAARVAEQRRGREGLSVGLLPVVLRRVWIEAQADAMERRTDFETALGRLLERERELALEEE